MKKKNILKIGIIYVLILSLLVGQGSVAFAAELTPEVSPMPTESPVIEEVTDSAEEPSVEPTEVPFTDESVEPTEEPFTEPTVEPSEEPSEQPSEDVPEASTEEPTQEPTEEESAEPNEDHIGESSAEPTEEPSEEPSVEPTEELCVESAEEQPAEESITLSEKQLQDKKKLRENLSLIKSLTEGIDYVAGEVLVYAETEELANTYADALDGNVISYAGNYALITLSGSAFDTILMSADADTLIPAAWPNYISKMANINESETQVSSEISSEIDITVSDDLQGVGQISGDYTIYREWHHDMLESELVWEEGYRGAGTTVAILSTGYSSSSSDVNITAYSIGLGSGDGNGRGTKYASVIAGLHNGASYYSGIAPDANLVSIKILTDECETTANNACLGLMRAIQLNVDVICMDYTSIGPVPNIEEAIEMAYEKGITVFVTAGDKSNNSKYYPAAYSHAYGVAALNPDKSRMYCSTYGSAVRYAAPGGDEDVSEKGTGFATAVVSAQAAVLLSSGKVKGEGSARVDKLISLMDKSCKEANGSGLGKGIVSMAKALNIVTPLQKPKAPKFVDKAGTYKVTSKTIWLTSQPGTFIYYTTNGKDVSNNGKLATGAKYYEPEEGIYIDDPSVTIKAIAISNYTQQISEQTVAKYQLKPPVSNIYIYSVSGTDKVMLLKKENTLKLKAKIYPDIAVGKTLTWSVSGKPKGISVDENGLVTVKKTASPGSYNILAKTKNGKVGIFPLTVVAVAEKRIASLTTSKTVYNLKTDEIKDAPLVITMTDGTTKLATFADIVVKSSDTSVVSAYTDHYKEAIELVGENKPGKATVTVYTTDGSGLKLKYTVNVKAPVNSISISGKDKVLTGKSIQLKKSISPSNASKKAVKWSVSPSGKGVKVDSTGKVTVSKSATIGNYTITCKAKDGSGVVGQKTIEVTKDKVKSINISKSSVTVFNANTPEYIAGVRVPVTIKGGDTTSWTVTSNKSYVQAYQYEDYIYITASSYNKNPATVTVKSTDGTGIKDTIKVNVINKPSGLKISLPSGRCAEVAKGKTLSLKAVLGDDNGKLTAKNKKLKWMSSNPEIMKVDKNTGKVTCLAEDGTAIIRAITTDGSYLEDTIKLTAIKPATSVYLAKRTVNEEKIDSTITIPAGEIRYYRLCQKHADGTIYRGRHEMKFTSDKAGLYTEMINDGFDVKICGTKKGTYKLTISCADGSSAKKVYTVKVQ